LTLHVSSPSPNGKSAAEVKAKLHAATQRRAQQEAELKSKLADRSAHAESVRQNKRNNKGARSESTDDLLEAQRLVGSNKIARG